MTGYAFQLAALIGPALVGKPHGAPEVVAAIAFPAVFLLGRGFGPGAYTMTYASLSYPTSLRGVAPASTRR